MVKKYMKSAIIIYLSLMNLVQEGKNNEQKKI